MDTVQQLHNQKRSLNNFLNFKIFILFFHMPAAKGDSSCAPFCEKRERERAFEKAKKSELTIIVCFFINLDYCSANDFGK